MKQLQISDSMAMKFSRFGAAFVIWVCPEFTNPSGFVVESLLCISCGSLPLRGCVLWALCHLPNFLEILELEGLNLAVVDPGDLFQP